MPKPLDRNPVDRETVTRATRDGVLSAVSIVAGIAIAIWFVRIIIVSSANSPSTPTRVASDRLGLTADRVARVEEWAKSSIALSDAIHNGDIDSLTVSSDGVFAVAGKKWAALPPSDRARLISSLGLEMRRNAYASRLAVKDPTNGSILGQWDLTRGYRSGSEP